MRPVLQTRFGYPEGNCFMACLASIFEVEIEDCPDLLEAESGGAYWWQTVRDFALERGYYAVYISQSGEEPRVTPKGLSIAGGDSPRPVLNDKGENAGHAVVMDDGILLHDPHPSGDGLGGPVDGWYVFLPLVRNRKGADRE